MFEHLGTILWLKWRLLRHSMTKATGALAVVLTVLIVIGVAFITVGASVGLFALGALADLEEQGALPVLGITDGLVFFFCIFWIASIMTELQRSDMVDMRRMMYLPVSLKSVFGINFAFSLLTPAGVLFIFPAMALVAGLAVRNGPVLLTGLVTVLAFYLAVSGWTYYFRGWLAALMEDKRKRRMLIMVLPMFFILVGWAPQFLIRLGPRWLPGDPLTVLMAGNMLLPPGWLPLALQSFVLGDVYTGLACTIGLLGLGVLPLSMGYRATRRHYLGIQTRRERKRGTKSKDTRVQPVENAFMGKTIPGFDEETSAVTMASIKMLSRHPTVRMQLIAPFVVGVFLFALYFLRSGGMLQIPGIARNVIPTAALAWPLLNGAMLFANIFGTDGNGFRSLILLPTDRRTYILGRNLALGALFGGQMLVFVLLAFAIFRTSLLSLVIAVLNVGYVVLIISALGNICSLYLPYHLPSDSMRGPKNKPVALLTTFLFLFLLPLILLPPMACALIDAGLTYVYEGWWFPAGAVLSLLFLGVALLSYRWLLDVCGNILAVREAKILETLTKGND
ncbi:MAG: hypothetical protein R6V12_02570 [Candidatus Hydrogenedentota bacterium]